ncbi:hypothetical protein D3C71_1881640 [compost metagenome]
MVKRLAKEQLLMMVKILRLSQPAVLLLAAEGQGQAQIMEAVARNGAKALLVRLVQ